MIGYCAKLKSEVLLEAECQRCKDIDLTLCIHWKEINELNSVESLFTDLQFRIFNDAELKNLYYNDSFFREIINALKDNLNNPDFKLNDFIINCLEGLAKNRKFNADLLTKYINEYGQIK